MLSELSMIVLATQKILTSLSHHPSLTSSQTINGENGGHPARRRQKITPGTIDKDHILKGLVYVVRRSLIINLRAQKRRF